MKIKLTFIHYNTTPTIRQLWSQNTSIKEAFVAFGHYSRQNILYVYNLGEKAIWNVDFM